MDFQWIFNDFYGFSWIFNDFHRFSLIFNGFSKKIVPVLDGLRPLGGGYSCLNTVVSLGASSKNRTSVPTRSAAIGAHRQPSAAFAGLWVGVKRGYGSPPSISPRHLFLVIYKVGGCVCCLLLSHAGGVGGFIALTAYVIIL